MLFLDTKLTLPPCSRLWLLAEQAEHEQLSGAYRHLLYDSLIILHYFLFCTSILCLLKRVSMAIFA